MKTLKVARWALRWQQELATIEVDDDFDETDSDAIWNFVGDGGATDEWDGDVGELVDAEPWTVLD